MLVARAEALSAVMKVTELARRTMSRVRGRPTFPTTHPNLRYIISPRMVRMLGV
jgi:hypothetical protein